MHTREVMHSRREVMYTRGEVMHTRGGEVMYTDLAFPEMRFGPNNQLVILSLV